MKRLKQLLVAGFLSLFFIPDIASISVFAWQVDQEGAPQHSQGYAVMVDGYEILRVRQNLGVISAEQRAQRISSALQALTTAPDFDPKLFAVVDEGGVTTIRYSDDLILTINDAEARAAGLPRNVLASQYLNLLRQKLPIARGQHTPRYLWRAAGYTALAAAVYALVVWLILLGVRRLLHLIRTPRAQLPGIKIQEAEIVHGARLTALLASLIKLGRVVLIVVATYILLATAFSYFPWTREHGRRLLGYVTGPLIAIRDSTLDYLPKAVYIFVVLLLVHFALRFLRVIAAQVESGRIRFAGFYPEWTQPTYKISKVFVYAFAAVMIYPYLPGESSPAFKGISVFIGVLFSLGSTSAVANFVAGVILIYTRGFRKGDWISIGDNMGEVMRQSMLATHLRTIRNEEITIPNSVVLSSYVTNFSLMAQEEGVVLHTAITIGYDAPWRTIHKLLIEAALKTPCILQDPPPFVFQSELENSYVRYEINAYTRDALKMPFIYSDLHANIQDAFFAAGIEIMSPIFHALRDGNHIAMPANYLPKSYRAPAFRVAQPDTQGNDAK